jgi:hypothetical protein
VIGLWRAACSRNRLSSPPRRPGRREQRYAERSFISAEGYGCPKKTRWALCRRLLGGGGLTGGVPKCAETRVFQNIDWIFMLRRCCAKGGPPSVLASLLCAVRCALSSTHLLVHYEPLDRIGAGQKGKCVDIK